METLLHGKYTLAEILFSTKGKTEMDHLIIEEEV